MADETPALASVDDVHFDRLSIRDGLTPPSSSGTSSPSRAVRPESQRSTTDPSNLLSGYLKERPRNPSPYSRPHLRSQSHASALSAPPMARTKSLPIVSNTAKPLSPARSPVRPSSPLRHSTGRASPRRSFEDAMPRSGTPSFMDIEIIAEDSELDITPRGTTATTTPPTLHSATFQRSNSGRRRPSSPLHHQYSPSTPSISTTPSSPNANLRFNEAFPKEPMSAGLSSYPSTPTSLRSRSPSISSLETIPDSPDAEEEAQEAYRLAQLKAAAERAEAEAEEDKNDPKDPSGRWASRKDRKRWSVCGAERRTDFEMETIWED